MASFPSGESAVARAGYKNIDVLRFVEWSWRSEIALVYATATEAATERLKQGILSGMLAPAPDLPLKMCELKMRYGIAASSMRSCRKNMTTARTTSESGEREGN